MKERIVAVSIKGLNEDGDGIGSFTDGSGDNKSVSVPFTAPGDEANVLLLRGRRGHFQGRLQQMLSASPARVNPRCVHFGTCGGCRLQHISYEDQLTHKEALVRNYFEGLIEPDPIIAADDSYEYRNKMEFSFNQDKEQNRYLGLYEIGRRGRVLNLTECHLVLPWFIEAKKKVFSFFEERGILAYNPYKDSGSLRTLTLRESKTGKGRLVMLTVSGRPEYALKKGDLEAFKALFQEEHHTSVYLRIHQAIKGQPTEFFEMHLAGPETLEEILDIDLSPLGRANLFIQISPSAFFQPNTRQAMRLYSEALKCAKLTDQDVLFDLYCGTGTLGLIASPFVKQVIGVEISEEACLDARENARMNGRNNLEIFCGPVSSLLKKEHGFPKPSVILLDPPRSGLDAAGINEVLSLEADRMVYISCNPKTQARDIAEIVKRGYRLVRLQPVDQFPHTPHIENIALLHRIN